MHNKLPYVQLATDYLLNHSPEYIPYNPFLKMIGFIYNPDEVEISKEEQVLASMNNFNSVIAFAKEKGYIIKPKDNHSTVIFELTELGRNVKAVGGISKYNELMKNTQQVVFENIKWAKKAAEAAEKTALSSERSATAAELSTGYNKNTMILIAVYTALTFILVVVGVITCRNSQASTPNATMEIKAITDTLPNK